MNPNLTILQGDVLDQLKTLPDNSIQCCVTSPPYYGLRSYLKADDPNKAKEIGSEQTPQQYVDKMVLVLREVRRVLREDGTLWLNLGDSYASSSKSGTGEPHRKTSSGKIMPQQNRACAPGVRKGNLIGIPWRVAFALQADGWTLRAVCPWVKRNVMPESTKGRPTTVVETVFMLTKSERCYYDGEAVKVASAQPDRKRADRFAASKDATNTVRHGEQSVFTGAATRARRSSDWFFESWQGMLQDKEGDPLAFIVNTKPYRAAHFATFPTDLIRPMIKASTSERGCCPECGVPIKRVLTKSGGRDWHQDRMIDGVMDGEVNGEGGNKRGRSHEPLNDVRLTETVGWQPSCGCDVQPPIPCTVLDPFGGSGTTAQVALEQGCKAIVIELNPEYIPLIRQRCEPKLPNSTTP